MIFAKLFIIDDQHQVLVEKTEIENDPQDDYEGRRWDDSKPGLRWATIVDGVTCEMRLSYPSEEVRDKHFELTTQEKAAAYFSAQAAWRGTDLTEDDIDRYTGFIQTL